MHTFKIDSGSGPAREPSFTRAFVAGWSVLCAAFVVLLLVSVQDIEAERVRLTDSYRSFATAIRTALTVGLDEKISAILEMLRLSETGHVTWDFLMDETKLSPLGSANPRDRAVHAFLRSRSDELRIRVDGQQVGSEAMASITKSCTAAMRRDASAFTILSPIRPNTSAPWVLPLAHFLDGRTGCNADIVLLRTRILNDLLQDLDVDFAALVSTEGTVLARYPDEVELTGRSVGTTTVFSQALARQSAGTLLATSPLDGKARILAYGSMSELPVIVTVGFDAARVDQAISERYHNLTMWGMAATIVLLVLFLWQRRATLERDAATVALARRSADFQRRLQIALETLRKGIWDWSLPDDRIELSQEWLQRFNLAEPGDDRARMEAWLERLHGDDRPRFLQVLDGTRSGAEESFETVFRMQETEDSWRWVQCAGSVVERDRTGIARRIVGTLSDITEDEERNIELRLSGLVFDEAGEGIAITDAQNRFIRVNRAFTEISGYSEAEVLGRQPSVLSSGLQGQSFYHDLWTSLHSKGFWRGEIWNRHKSGAFYAEWLSISVARDATGAVLRHVAIFSDITEQKQKDELIQRQALYDALTNLPNRRLFFDRLEQEIHINEREGKSFELLFVDLDHFKEINDHHGHATGDRVLIEVASRLLACCRSSDTVARMGGDEFVILARNSDPTQAERLAAKVIAALHQPIALDGSEFLLSASVGVSSYPRDGKDAQQLLSSADTAMYAAKNDGRNTFHFFTHEMQEAARQRMELLNALQVATRQGTFELYMQPIFSIGTGRPVKAEALIRWKHNNRYISPAQFIPVAEDSDLICDISDWVFERTLAMFRDIAGRGLLAEEVSVAINKSARHLETRDSPTLWLNRLAEEGIAPKRLELEITERLLLRENDRTAEHIERFAAAGVTFSVDDFGTGYSALAYLKSLPIKRLKIDKSFICDIVDNAENRSIVEAITVMAHKIGLTTIAEGVETEAQLDILRQMGCDFAQGFLLARPMPIPEFIAFLESHGLIRA